MKEEHKHDWYVITSIHGQKWDDFMRYRGNEEDRPITLFIKSQTLICNLCQLIKEIE